MPARKDGSSTASAWRWAERRVAEEMEDTLELMPSLSKVEEWELRQSYRLHFPTHNVTVRSGCKRNCRSNPRCLMCLGESKWLGKEKMSSESRSWLEEEEALLSERRESHNQPVGLVNLGNTCYINSFLQILFHNTRLRRALYNYQAPLEKNSVNLNTDKDLSESGGTGVVQALQLILALMEHGDRLAVDPAHFVNQLNLDPEVQQDAQEFSKLFLALLESHLQTQQSPDVRDSVRNMFEGHYSYITICDHCQHESHREASFYEIDLAIQGCKTLDECLKVFVSEERLEGDNQYMCSHCNAKRDAKRFVRLTTLPPVLNLQLNRFIFDLRSGSKKKVNSYLEFGDEIDLSSFIAPNHNKKRGKRGNESRGKYVLTGVLMHVGGQAHHGHYVAHVQEMASGCWYKFSDHLVERLDKKNSNKIGDEADVIDTEINKVKGKNGNVIKPKKPSRLLKGRHSSNSAYMLVYMEKNYHSTLRMEAEESRKERELLSFHNEGNNVDVNEKESKGQYFIEDGVAFDRCLPSYLVNQVLQDRIELDNAADLLQILKEEEQENQQQKSEYVLDALRCLPYLEEETSTSDAFEFVPTSILTAFFDKGGEVERSKEEDKKNGEKGNAEELDNEVNGNVKIRCIHKKMDVHAVSEAKIVNKDFVDRYCPNYSEASAKHRLIGSSALCVECVQTQLQQLRLKHSIDVDTKRVQALLKTQANDDGFWVGKNSLRRWKALARARAILPFNNDQNNNDDEEDDSNRERDTKNHDVNEFQESGKPNSRNSRLIDSNSNLPSQESTTLKRRLPTSTGMECALTTEGGFEAKRIKKATNGHDTNRIEYKGKEREGEETIVDELVPDTLCKGRNCEDDMTSGSENRSKSSENEQKDQSFNEDLLCFHGQLSSDSSVRRLVCKELWMTLLKYFPSAPTFQAGVQPCPQCQEANNHSSRLQAVERSVAMEQRSLLNDIVNERNRPSWSRSSLHKVYIVPRSFVVQWRTFIRAPQQHERVTEVCNQQLLCQHNGLVHYVDLDNETDYASVDAWNEKGQSRLYMVSEDEWRVMKTMFKTDKEISVTRGTEKGSEEGKKKLVLQSDPQVCYECVFKREQEEEQMRLSYAEAKVFVRLLDESTTRGSDPDFNTAITGSVEDSCLRRSGRRPKVRGEKAVSVKSDMKLRDLKIKIMNLFGVAPFDQTLFTDGRFLNGDNQCTLADLRVMPDALIYVRADVGGSENNGDDQGSNNENDAFNNNAFPELGFKGTSLLQS